MLNLEKLMGLKLIIGCINEIILMLIFICVISIRNK